MTGPNDETYSTSINYLNYLRGFHNMERADGDIGTALDFDEFTADHSATRLGADATDLNSVSTGLPAAPATAFGVSSLGQRLQEQVDLAHGKLRGAVDLLSTAMDNYAKAVKAAKKTFIDVDDHAGTSMTAIRQTFHAGNTSATTPIAEAPAVKDRPEAPDSSTPDQPDASTTASTTTPSSPASTAPDPYTALLHPQGLPTFTSPYGNELQQLFQQPADGGK